MRANASLSGTSLPTTCLLDKNIVRAVFEARVRVRRGLIPLPHQARAAIVYQALLHAELTTHVTPETVHAAQRRDPLIAASLFAPLTTLTPGRYLRRWARRLRGFGFSREDSVILAYGSFGVDSRRQLFGAEVILSTDQPLMRHFSEQQSNITRRFRRMTCQLALPYRLAQLPTLMSPAEMLTTLIKSARGRGHQGGGVRNT
jgi:hypothetical protein